MNPPPGIRAAPTPLQPPIVIIALALSAVAAVNQAPPPLPAPPPTSIPAAPGQIRSDLTSGLIGSRHDFSQRGEFGRDLCLPCHTPHQVLPPTPEWDQRVVTTPPLRAYEDLQVALNSWSLLCLGCHDGVTAQDVFSSAHALTVTEQLSGVRFGTRGLRSHPMGIAYPLAVEGYRSPNAVEASGLPLPDGRIQCTTCHDAHNTHNHAGMLRISNQRSQLCLACHQI